MSGLRSWSVKAYPVAWWCCVASLPWLDRVHGACLIFLGVVSLIEGGPFRRISSIGQASWSWPFLAYYTLLILTLSYTPDIGEGLFNLEKKISFVVLPWIAITGPPLDQSFIRRLRLTFVYSCLIVMVISLGNAWYYWWQGGEAFHNFSVKTAEAYRALHPNGASFWMNFSYIQLAYWTNLHPTYFAMYLVFCIAIQVTEPWKSSVARWGHGLLVIIIVLFISLLASRIALLALIIILLWLGWRDFQQSRKFKSGILGLATIFLLLLIWFNPMVHFRMIDEVRTTNYSVRPTTELNSVNYRLLEWGSSWSAIRERPLTGWGVGGSQEKIRSYYAAVSPQTEPSNNAHNQFLQVWMDTGIPGLIAFIFCLVLGLRHRRSDDLYVAFILIFSVMCLTESIAEKQKGIVFFMTFQTLFLGFNARHK